MTLSIKKAKIKKRHKRIRAKTSGTSSIPRLSVFRSANHIYCQLFDDEKNKVILTAKDFEIKKTKTKEKTDKKAVSVEAAADKKEKTKNKPERKLGSKEILAFEVGKLIAQKALEKKITKVVFDRGGFAYHGRIQALAEGAREGGLKF